jgi:phenylalanyl-tRNA synthetase beta chain
VAGVVGAVSDAEREKRRLPAAAFAGELLIGALPADGSRAAFRPYSAFPPVPADLSFAQPRDLAWATLRRFVEERKPPTLESVRLLDRFEPPGVAPDRVKTTLRLTFRAADRTLEQEEVNGEVRRLADALRDELGVEL